MARKMNEKHKIIELKAGKLKAIRESIAFTLKKQEGRDMKFNNLPIMEMRMFAGVLNFRKCRKIAAFLQINSLMPKHMETIKNIMERETGRKITQTEINRIYEIMEHMQDKICNEMAKEKKFRLELNYWGYHLEGKKEIWISGAKKEK